MSWGHFLLRLSLLDIPLCLFHAYQRQDTVSYRTLICPRDDIIPLFRSSALCGSPERRSDRTDFPFMEAERRQKEDVLTAPRLTAFVVFLQTQRQIAVAPPLGGSSSKPDTCRCRTDVPLYQPSLSSSVLNGSLHPIGCFGISSDTDWSGLP